MKKNSNIYEVAKLAGVSPMTVTRTFNGKAPVAARTKERVLEAAGKLDFRPNLLARDLKRGSTRSVGVLWSLCHPYSGAAQVRSISERLLRHGYSCHLADSLSNSELVVRCLEDFVGRRMDAVVLDDNRDITRDARIVTLLRRFDTVLLARRRSESPLEFDQVVCNQLPALRELFRCLKANGRKRLGIFNPRAEQMEMLRLLAAETELPIEFLPTPENRENNRTCEAKYIAERFPGTIPFDAFLSYVDETAAALMGHLLDRGLRVPEDIALCGYNNSSMAPFFRPPLASIDRGDSQVGPLLADLLLDRLTDPGRPRQIRRIDYQFIPRRSVGIQF